MVVARGEVNARPAAEELCLTASAKDAVLAQSLQPQALNGLLAKACAAAAAEQRAALQLAKQCAKTCACVDLHHLCGCNPRAVCIAMCLCGLLCMLFQPFVTTDLDVCFLRQSAAHAAGV